MLNLALAAHRAGNLVEAEHFYKLVLASDKKQFDALHMLGIVHSQRGSFEEAARLFHKASKIRPNNAQCHYNYGNALLLLQQYEKALACYDKALALDPGYAEAHFNRGNALLKSRRFGEAITSYDKLLGIIPNYADAYCNRGNALQELKRFDEALASFDKALQLKPGDAEFHANRGNALCELNRFDEALASFDNALRCDPNHAVFYYNRGNVLTILGRLDEAIDSLDKALLLKPNDVEFYQNRCKILHRLGRLEEELATYDKVLAISSGDAEFFYNRAIVLQELGRFEEALADYDKAFALNVALKYLEGARLYTKLFLCDWSNLDAECSRLLANLRKGAPASEPFLLLTIPSSLADQFSCAQMFVKDKYPAVSRLHNGGAGSSRRRYSHDRIRVAYVSSDLRNHPIGFLTAGLFEHHDRSRFEMTAISFGADQESNIRRRIKESFEHFIDAKSESDEQIEDLIGRLEIDIAVDLNGFTTGARPNIFARRPAPIQVNYLGYPGTMGADYFDYIVADRTLIPESECEFYLEKVVWLPDSYQANDNRRSVADRTLTRRDCGLPEAAFVFCCFNNHFKTMPEMFDIWMRLLKAVEGSVLWLLEGNATVSANLRREAEKRGVSSERLIFAPRTPIEDHLARQRQADLFLDTLPYNAHTTASDALWVGLPVLTCLGPTFAGRVAGSLLKAAGHSELVTTSLEDYERLALRLARDPDFLASIKKELIIGRDTCRLFNTERFARHIESAYTKMWERHQRGELPQSFAVDPIH